MNESGPARTARDDGMKERIRLDLLPYLQSEILWSQDKIVFTGADGSSSSYYVLVPNIGESRRDDLSIFSEN